MKGILPENHSFQGRERLILFQICLFTYVEETHVSFQRKRSVLAAAASRALFPCENWVSVWTESTSTLLPSENGVTFWKKYFLQIRIQGGEIINLLLNRPIKLSWQNSCISWKKTIGVRSWNIVHCFPVRIELVFERNTSWKS
jgi:hypothetical protein